MKFSLGSITDALFEKDPNTNTEVPTPAKAPTADAPSLSALMSGNAAPVAATPVTALPPGSLCKVGANPADVQGFVERLRKALAGDSHSESIGHFMAIAESLADALPEEGARFRAALKMMARTEQVTQEQLAQSFQAMLGVLNNENTKFSASAAAQTKTQVTSREQQVTTLNQQIEQLSQQRDSIATDLATARIQISSTQASFNTAVGIIQAEVQDSLNKLKIYAPQVAMTTK